MRMQQACTGCRFERLEPSIDRNHFYSVGILQTSVKRHTAARDEPLSRQMLGQTTNQYLSLSLSAPVNTRQIDMVWIATAVSGNRHSRIRTLPASVRRRPHSKGTSPLRSLLSEERP